MKSIFIPLIVSVALAALGWWIVGPYFVAPKKAPPSKVAASNAQPIVVSRQLYFPEEALDQEQVLNGQTITITGVPTLKTPSSLGASPLASLPSLVPAFVVLRGSMIIIEESGDVFDAAMEKRSVRVKGVFTSTGSNRGMLTVNPSCQDCVR